MPTEHGARAGTTRGRIVAYVDRLGYLRCTSCAEVLFPDQVDAEGYPRPVFERDEPHASETCDTCHLPVRRLVLRAAHAYAACYEHSESEISLDCECHPDVYGGRGLRTGLHTVHGLDLPVYVIHPTMHRELFQHYVVLLPNGSLSELPRPNDHLSRPRDGVAIAAKRKILSRKLAGWSGQEGCQRLLNNPPSEDCLGKTTRHYGENVDYGDGVTGFTGWRGPYCSTACYRTAYPEP